VKLWLLPDASPGVGSGHVMRTLALAEVAEERGYAVQFVLNGQEHVSTLIQRGFNAREDAQGDWLRLVEAGDPVVFDGYDFAEEDLSRPRKLGATVVVIDDFEREHPLAHLVLNPSLDEAVFHAAPKRPLLAGLRFALVRREFRPFRRERGDEGHHLLISLGQSDTSRSLLPRLIALVQRASYIRHLSVTHPQEWGGPDAGTTVDFSARVPDPAGLFDSCDLAIAPASTTALELLYMGVPTIPLVLVDNQRGLGQLLEHGGIRVIDQALHTSPERELEDLLGSLADPVARRRLSRTGLALIDGGGAERVLNEITDRKVPSSEE
jgi:UDP-2,4-diacetamido-2,4,6-trideoxy-beta-L-altropyranose hydrolase